MLIEFAGIPGSGKTFVCEKFRAWLKRERIEFVDVDKFIRENAAREARNIPTVGLIGKKFDLGNKSADVFLRAFISFFRTHHEYVGRYSSCLFEWEKDEAAIRSALSAFLYGCARYAYCMDALTSPERSLIVHEEGFAHRLFTLFGYDRDGRNADSRIRSVAEQMPVPQAVVWTRCSPAICYERMSARSGKRFPERMAGMEREDALGMLEAGERVLAAGFRVLQERGADIVEVRTDNGFEEEAVFARAISKFGGSHYAAR
jgi:thymidylate kinase